MVAAFSHDLGNFGTPGLSGTRYRSHGAQVCLYLKAYQRLVAQIDEFLRKCTIYLMHHVMRGPLQVDPKKNGDHYGNLVSNGTFRCGVPTAKKVSGREFFFLDGVVSF